MIDFVDVAYLQMRSYIISSIYLVSDHSVNGQRVLERSRGNQELSFTGSTSKTFPSRCSTDVFGYAQCFHLRELTNASPTVESRWSRRGLFGGGCIAVACVCWHQNVISANSHIFPIHDTEYDFGYLKSILLFINITSTYILLINILMVLYIDIAS